VVRLKTKKTDRLHLDRRARNLATVTDGDDDDLLTQREMAAWFAVTPDWMIDARLKGYGPPYIEVEPLVYRYRRGTARLWLKGRERTRAEGYGSHTGPRKNWIKKAERRRKQMQEMELSHDRKGRPRAGQGKRGQDRADR
jgi:hypothetical protein